MKIELEPHYRWPERVVMRVEGSPADIEAAYDWVFANRKALRASPFWMRGYMGWCEIHRDGLCLVRERWL